MKTRTKFKAREGKPTLSKGDSRSKAVRTKFIARKGESTTVAAPKKSVKKQPKKQESHDE